jgi:hypothetical protein
MKKLTSSLWTAIIFAVLSIVVVSSIVASAQNPAPSTAQQQQASQQAQAEKAFAMGNTLMEQRKPDQALVHYKEALSTLSNEPALLFNAGVAAFGSKDFHR